ncbi:hypothetical protein EC973_007593 [Apophysomyces ossiformis]|uniref:Uncharacterized protein n=1 Tax=Apophysomyces ossiformis TaxID=679940 RepID=A0A8H7BGE4_9FUNG|nr:hypothetical protein EC973_007593 [Apophysomyces ossiformis]
MNVLHIETLPITDLHSSNNAPDTDNDDDTSSEQPQDNSINTPTSSKHNFEQLEYHPPNNISSIPWMVAGVDLANIFSRYKHDHLIDHFGQTTLDKITEALLSNILDKDLDWEDAEYVKLSRIVNNRIGKLPTNDIKDEDSLGENELTCTFFDPILSRLIANPINNVHLRWSDIMASKPLGNDRMPRLAR